jgi:hypothetical protein
VTSRFVSAYVDIDLSEFDDQEVFAEASARGLDLLPADIVNDLAFALQHGDCPQALIYLDALAAGNRVLLDAVDKGRRRLR